MIALEHRRALVCKRAMDEDKRTALEERRRFMHRRNAAQALRSALEPAWTALETSGEAFRVFGLGEEPAWNPRWVPPGYSYIPWRQMNDVEWSEDDLDAPALATLLVRLVGERLAPDQPLLFVAEGKTWSVELSRAAFEHHAEALLEAAWCNAFVAAPPAQWLIHAQRRQAAWKDG